MQRKAEETQFKQAQENQRAADRLEFDYDRLATQDQQSDERLRGSEGENRCKKIKKD